MDPTALIPLLYLLPTDWQKYVTTALLFMGSMTVLVAALRSALPAFRALAAHTRNTRDDQAVSIVADVLNDLAGLVEWCLRFTEVLAGHRAPPVKAIAAKLKRSPPVTVLMISIALLATPCYACAGSQVRTHAQIADALDTPILEAKQAIEHRAYEQVAHIKAAALTPEEADSKIAALRERYRPIEASMLLVIEGYNAYVEAIQKAHADGESLQRGAALALLSRWQTLLSHAKDLGVSMPEIPEALRSLVP